MSVTSAYRNIVMNHGKTRPRIQSRTLRLRHRGYLPRPCRPGFPATSPLHGSSVGPNVPFHASRSPIVATALIEVAAGLALLWRRTARASALLLTALYCVFTLLWVPKIFENLRNFDPIGNFFEEFSIMAAGAVLYAVFSPTESPISRRESLFARLYALSAISLRRLATSITCRGCWPGSQRGFRHHRCSGPTSRR